MDFKKKEQSSVIHRDRIINESNEKPVKMALSNAGSICNKSKLIAKVLHFNRIDIMAITETWFKGN
jgi:hypothetical protein